MKTSCFLVGGRRVARRVTGRALCVAFLIVGASGLSGFAQNAVALSGEVVVREIKAVHRHGQTFVTFRDVAEGAAGAEFRYALYRADKPITEENFVEAELCYGGILNNSAKLFGSAFTQEARQNAEQPVFSCWDGDTEVPRTIPTFILEEGGEPLPMWSGLAVRTADKSRSSYYAVVATDKQGSKLSTVVPGASATMAAVEEKVAPIQPIKLLDSNVYGRYRKICRITGAKGLPLRLTLHASNGRGGNAGDHGDYYIYFATPEMGWRDGLPGIFSVMEREYSGVRSLTLHSRDAIESPDGTRARETLWFGLYCEPEHRKGEGPRAWPFTENRVRWMVDWVAQRYEADTSRITASGGSMGAWGSTSFAFRETETFAAVYPNRPRTRQKGLASLVGKVKIAEALMSDGKTLYLDRMDSVKFVKETSKDLPVYIWCCGLRDGFATFEEQVDMVRALTEGHHGFAFAWNDGDHSSGAGPMSQLTKWYGPDKFALDKSYPAFGNSSLDDDLTLGVGDAKKDAKNLPTYFINAGFTWSDVTESAGAWSVKLGNELCKEPMTVDVTPRRCQSFKAAPGAVFKWSNSAGGAGEVVADANGLVTIRAVTINPGETTTLVITAQ